MSVASSPERNGLPRTLRQTSIFGYGFFLKPSERMTSTSRMNRSPSSPGPGSPSVSAMTATLPGDARTVIAAPALRWRQLSFPSRSMSNPWRLCLIVATRRPRRLSSGMSLSTRVVLPLPE